MTSLCSPKLLEMVTEALDNAKDNGSPINANNMREAADLVLLDAGIEDYILEHNISMAEVADCVQIWKLRHAN